MATLDDGTQKEYAVVIAGSELQRGDIFMLANKDVDQITLISCEVSDPLGQAREVVVAIPKENLTEKVSTQGNTSFNIDSIVARQEVGNGNYQAIPVQSSQNQWFAVSNLFFLIFGLIFVGSITIATSLLRHVTQEDDS